MALSRLNLGPAFAVQAEELFNVGRYRYQFDFCETWRTPQGMEFGVCEVKGSRSSQEDAMCVSQEAVNHFDAIPFEHQEVILHETFATLQTAYGQHLTVGSTACCTISWIDANNILHITTANLGDSSAYVVIVNKDNEVNKLAHFSTLNTWHQPSVASERERIGFLGGVVAFGRLGANLAVSRAFGDTKYDNNGISHTPDVTQFTYQLAADQQAFVVVTCDGMDSIKDSIGRMVANESTRRSAEIANVLVRNAYLKNLTDNISAIVFNPCRLPTSAIMLDGHGGSAVSIKISNCFYPVLARIAANYNDTAWLDAARLRLETECARITNGIQQLKETRIRSLATIKHALDFYINKIKGSPDFEVYIEEKAGAVVGERNAKNGYSLTFATDNEKESICMIIEIAAKHSLHLWKTTCYVNDGHLKNHRCSFEFHEGHNVPNSFHSAMKEVLPFLVGKQHIQLESSVMLTRAASPTLFAQLVTGDQSNEAVVLNEKEDLRI